MKRKRTPCGHMRQHHILAGLLPCASCCGKSKFSKGGVTFTAQPFEVTLRHHPLMVPPDHFFIYGEVMRSTGYLWMVS